MTKYIRVRYYEDEHKNSVKWHERVSQKACPFSTLNRRRFTTTSHSTVATLTHTITITIRSPQQAKGETLYPTQFLIPNSSGPSQQQHQKPHDLLANPPPKPLAKRRQFHENLADQPSPKNPITQETPQLNSLDPVSARQLWLGIVLLCCVVHDHTETPFPFLFPFPRPLSGACLSPPCLSRTLGTARRT